MTEQIPAHQRFVQFVEAFYRDAGTELSFFKCDGSVPIAFEAMVDDVKFVVGYDPVAAGDAQLFVYCVFGPVPPHEEGAALRRLLELNLSLAREHNATYCIDTDTGEVACYLRGVLDPAGIPALHEQMDRIGRQAERWRQGDFGNDDDASRPARDGHASAPWVVFA
jgi:hypothetical protein